MKESESKSQQLVKVIGKFVKNTIIGQESAMFKVLYFKDKTLLQGLKELVMLQFQLNALETYLNTCYDGLVTEDDPYIKEQFGAMQKIMDHSPVCLINFVAVSCVNVYVALNRSTFDVSSYTEYIESVATECDKNIEIITVANADKVNHKCEGSKKAPALDPGQKMFTFNHSINI